MRVLLLTQWFPPEPTRVPATIAFSLRDAGIDTVVVTGYPNYPEGVVHAGYGNRAFASHIVDRVRVLRCPLYPSHDVSATRRAINYLTWALTSSVGVLRWRPSRNVDVSLVYSSPATAAIPAMVLRLLRRIPYVLLIEDLWPDSVLASGLTKRNIPSRGVVWLLNRFVNLSYRWARQIAVTSPGMLQALVTRGVPEEKISVVPNWLRGSLGERNEEDPQDGCVRFVYGGNLGTAQGVDVIIRALEILNDPSVRVDIVGNGLREDELKRLAHEKVRHQVVFHDRLPYQEFEQLTKGASGLLITLAANPLFDMTLPGKLQSSLRIGLPIIASAGRDVREVIETSDAGWTAPPGDAEALAAAFASARDAGLTERKRRGRNAVDCYDRSFSEVPGVSRLRMVLEYAISPSGA